MLKSKYFYDKQIRRYLLQISRIFSGFQVSDGFQVIAGQRIKKYKTVPVAHANLNRLGATYLSDNSENTLIHAPAIAFYISDMQPSAELRHYQHHTTNTNFTEKAKSPTGEYINAEGKKYSVSQVMPTPFDMKITVDIWASSIEQKMEILEQIFVFFNPGFSFRVNSSRFDMGQISNIELESVQWTSKSIPIGSSTDLDYSTLTFRIFPVLISAPAKITRQNIIKQISIGTNVTDELQTLDDIFESSPMHHIYVSPTGFSLEIKKEVIDGNKKHVARLISADSDDYQSWSEMFKLYGVDEDGECLLRIRQTADIDVDENDVYAKISISSDDMVGILEYDIDTFKPNTIEHIKYIISGTNENTDIFNEENGTRVLVASNMSSDNPVWAIDIPANSIIEKTLSGWIVVFDPTNATEEQYVLNISTGEQYKYILELSAWQPTTVGTYVEGYWSFDIQKVLSK